MDYAQHPLARPDKLFIDGEWVSPQQKGAITVISPATERPYVEVAQAGMEDIDRAIGAARRAFDEGPWPRLPVAERAHFLHAIATEVEASTDDIAAIWPNEMGITHAVASAFSGTIGGIYRAYAHMAHSFDFLEPRLSALAPAAYIAHEPVGVVGAIIPWNGPISLIAHKIAPALLAGCTVIVKASPEAPGHALLMAEILEKVGLPAGVVNVLTADRDVSEQLVRDPRVDKIAFTGSTATGQAIGSILGGRIGRQTLELGGKSPAIICEDYDIDLAAETLAERACALTGQVCASLTRLIVPRRRHDDFLEALASRMAKISVGDPFDPATGMGPLATAQQRSRVEGHIARAVADGYAPATGGARPAHLDRGWFVEPTVFGNVDNSSAIAREEIFGPVLCVIPAQDEDEAVHIANDSPFGLAGAVFTNDAERAYRIMRQVRTGTMSQNRLKLDFSIGFGGFKQSGIGREGGEQGLRSFLETKTMLLDAPVNTAGQDAE
ncbi:MULTISPECIES: aldehyde dehydrogenase [Citromicrobium]|uniref:aldehyde dehydrogenase n=1 Tax=Citromicrobium TaxID=72173 RepID=UPI0001DD0A2D|nr:MULTISPECIES: aldehyde dehydrogenase [Citromicrobium]ALG60452.1 aldehyde dehydrogenase [Citromicrobium sp. JL477]